VERDRTFHIKKVCLNPLQLQYGVIVVGTVRFREKPLEKIDVREVE